MKKDDQQLVPLKERITAPGPIPEYREVRFGHRLSTEIVGNEESRNMVFPRPYCCNLSWRMP